MSGPLNSKKINQRFADFRKKLDIWKERQKVRERFKLNFNKQSTSIRDRLDKASTVEYTFDVEAIHEVLRHYHEFKYTLQGNFNQEKVINNFLVELPLTGQVIEAGDLERLIQVKGRKFADEMKILSEFTQSVKSECVMDGTKFSFFEIPDLIVRKKYSRENYEKIKKMILKVKSVYLKRKAEQLSHEISKKEDGKNYGSYDDDVSNRKSASSHSASKTANKEGVITDEDLVELILLDEVLA